MKIVVCVKQVIDPYVKIRVQPDETGVVTDGVKMAMNPFDEIALEEAIRLKEQKLAEEIIIVSVGSQKSQETLYHGLALGADRAILVETTESFCPLNIAQILKVIVQQEAPQLVLMGKQSIDGDNHQTPQMLASLLDYPQATNASKITLSKENTLLVTREVDAGLEEWSVPLPAVVSVDLRLNTPRYASLPNIMQAKRKPFSTQSLASMNLSLTPHVQIIKTTPPPQRPKGILVDSVQALVDKLRNEAKVLEG